MARLASSRSFDIRVDTDPSHTTPQEHRQPIKEYGEQWAWDADVKDYVRYTEGKRKSHASEPSDCRKPMIEFMIQMAPCCYTPITSGKEAHHLPRD
jgi:hypothetical protein